MSATSKYDFFVDSAPAVTPILPAAHTSRGLNFSEILQTRTLKKTACKFFPGNEILYLFYGKPSYRPKDDGIHSLDLTRGLFTFVLDISKIKLSMRFFPFDSGAAIDGLYKDYITHDGYIDGFRVDGGLEICQKIVGAFFGNNENYWTGFLDKTLCDTIYPLDFHSLCFARMNSIDVGTSFDKRSCSIEIQVMEDIILDKSNLLALIVPDRLRFQKDVVNIIADCEAELISYRWRKDTPSARSSEIEREMEGWLVRRGMINL